MNALQNKSKNNINIRISVDGKHPDQTSEDCIICCEKITDKAFVSVCRHYFCYKCIKEWAKVRAVCPLCVQPISGIIYNVRSANDYDLQLVKPPEKDILSNLDTDVDLWGLGEDDYFHDEIDDDDISEINFDETVAVLSSTDTAEDLADHYNDTMDEDDSDIASISDHHNDATETAPSADDFSEESSNYENEGTRSSQSSNSVMEDNGDSTDYENDDGSENEAESYYDSDENDDEYTNSYSDAYDEFEDNSPLDYDSDDDCGSVISWDQTDSEDLSQNYSDDDSSDSY